jgi:hypothetical protein
MHVISIVRNLPLEYIHTYIHTYIPLTLFPCRDSKGKSDVRTINPLVAFSDIHGGKREALFFYFVSDTTRDS